jgi:hypothetical protein
MFRKDLDPHLIKKSFDHSCLMVKWMKESSYRIEKLNFDLHRAKQFVNEEVLAIKEAMKNSKPLEAVDLFLC